MAYIKVDYSDDRVYGRYQTGPIVVVPTAKADRRKAHYYDLYDQTDNKLQTPVHPHLTRTGRYKIIANIFTKDRAAERHLNSSYFNYDHSGILGVQKVEYTEHYVEGKSANVWFTDAQIIYYYYDEANPLEIECDLINTSNNEPIDCRIFVEVHFLS